MIKERDSFYSISTVFQNLAMKQQSSLARLSLEFSMKKACELFSLVQLISVTQSCPTLCNPMNHSTPGLPIHHQLPESIQTHVHWISDTIQQSHLLSSPLLASMFPRIRVFSNESALRIRWPKYWSFSFSIKGLSRVFSNTAVQKHQFFGTQLSS